MRIMIVGAGAIGGFLACRLRLSGHEVCVVARGLHLEAIRESGLRLRTTEGSETVAYVKASDEPKTLGPQDLVITTVKAPALPHILNKIRPLIEQGTPIVTAMNGIFWWYAHGLDVSGLSPDTRRLDPDGMLASLLPLDQAIGMVIHSTNQVLEPGVVQNRSSRNRFVMGGATTVGIGIAEEIAAQLSAADTSFEANREFRSVVWRKLLRNLSTAPSSVLTGARAYDVINDPDVRNVARALFLEGAAVATAHGFTGLEQEVDEVFVKGSGARQKPSMSQDVDLGRPMEVDSLLRIVQDFARQFEIHTPTLDTVVALVLLRARLAGCYPSPT